MDDGQTPGTATGTATAPSPADEPALVERAARGEELDGEEQDALLAHYLGGKPKPGQREDGTPEVHTLKVPLDADGVRMWTCVVKTVRWEEWRDAQTKGTKDDEIDTFVISSYIVARALRRPALGPVVMELRDRDPEHAPKDAAALLRDYFEEVPGSLLKLSRKIVELSNLNEDATAGVREVEAGKT